MQTLTKYKSVQRHIKKNKYRNTVFNTGKITGHEANNGKNNIELKAQNQTLQTKM